MTGHEARHIAALQAFTLRARRIRAHSLSQDAALLQKLLNPQINIRVNSVTGETHITTHLPPEEQVESAAARVRPLILNDEDAYHAKVMNALLYFANKGGSSKQDIASIRELKRQWQKVNSKRDSNGYYEVRVKNPGEEENRISDNALAFSWIYGDVVHADPKRRAEGQAFGVDERYRAAVPVVVRLMMLAMTTLTYIQVLRTQGVVPDLGSVFEEEVVFTDSETPVKAQVFLAEYDENGNRPDISPIGESLGEGWKDFKEVFGIPTPAPADDGAE